MRLRRCQHARPQERSSAQVAADGTAVGGADAEETDEAVDGFLFATLRKRCGDYRPATPSRPQRHGMGMAVHAS